MARFRAPALPDLIETSGFRVDLQLDMYSHGKGQGGSDLDPGGGYRVNLGGFIGIKIEILCPRPETWDFCVDLPLDIYYHLGGQVHQILGGGGVIGKGVYRVNNSNFVSHPLQT